MDIEPELVEGVSSVGRDILSCEEHQITENEIK